MRILLPALLLLLAACGPDRSQPTAKPLGPEHYVIAPDDQPAPQQFMRYARPAVGKAGGLDIAVTTYKKPDGGPTIALFGVVHVADAPYFRVVQAELDAYETVLYEGVKPEHQSDADWQASFKEGGGESSALQQQIASWFGLQFQLHAIDYTRANFVHADMSLEEFLEKGGASLIPGMSKPAAHASSAKREKPEPDEIDPNEFDPDEVAPDEVAPDEVEVAEAEAEAERAALEAFEAQQRAGALSKTVRSTLAAVKSFGDTALGKPGPLRSLARRMFAETLGTTNIGHVLEMQPGFGDLILIQRNEVVMERLKETLATTKGSIAIFYGAAHMDDLEERLVKELGYERSKAQWLRAWAIRPPLR